MPVGFPGAGDLGLRTRGLSAVSLLRSQGADVFGPDILMMNIIGLPCISDEFWPWLRLTDQIVCGEDHCTLVTVTSAVP